MRGGTKRLGFIIVVVMTLSAIGSIIPFQSTVVPAWKIRVIDETGRPYAGMSVSQAWKHYSLELEGGENMETRQTDEAGYVEFPQRTLKLSLLSRALRSVYTHVLTLSHGSAGISADVAATGPQGYKSIKYVAGKPPPDQLVLPSRDKNP